jgi:DNA-binding transcriptional LysR family regulator
LPGPAIDDEDAVGFPHRRHQRFDIERHQRARIDHLDLDALAGQFLGGTERVLHHAAHGHHRHVAACALDVGTADRHQNVFAADRLGLSQPAVSNALNRLRALMGDPLFVRTRHGMEPTSFALRLCSPVQEGLTQIRTGLSQVMTFDPATSDRKFTILMNDVGAASFLPAAVQGLSKVAPGIDLHISELDHAEYEDALDSGVADLAIGRVMLADTFRSEFLLRSTYIAVLRTDHPALSRKRGTRPFLTLDSYIAAAQVVVSPRGATSNPVERAMLAMRLNGRVMLNVPHATSLYNIIPGTDLIATVPDRCRKFLCRDRQLTWAKLPIRIEPNMIYQWWHKRHDHDTEQEREAWKLSSGS